MVLYSLFQYDFLPVRAGLNLRMVYLFLMNGVEKFGIDLFKRPEFF